MSYRRANLSEFFRYLAAKLSGDGDVLEKAKLSTTQQWLVRALFAGADVSVIVSECCCDDRENAAAYGRLFKTLAEKIDLGQALLDFQDSTGLVLSQTQRWLVQAMFGEAEFCLSMSGGAGEGEGDPGGGRGEGDVGGGRGEGDVGGGRGEPDIGGGY